jgi:hypothetical protein
MNFCKYVKKNDKKRKKMSKKNVYLLMFYFINIQKNFLQNCFLYFIRFMCLCLLNFLWFSLNFLFFFLHLSKKCKKKIKQRKIRTKI